jgi:hypothetical protein
MSRTEDLNVKISEEALTCNGTINCGCCKAVAADEGSWRRLEAITRHRHAAIPDGATIAAMMKATGWQPHSVRGFLAGVVRKRLKLKLAWKEIDGNRVYQITSAAVASRQSRGRSA